MKNLHPEQQWFLTQYEDELSEEAKFRLFQIFTGDNKLLDSVRTDLKNEIYDLLDEDKLI